MLSNQRVALIRGGCFTSTMVMFGSLNYEGAYH